MKAAPTLMKPSQPDSSQTNAILDLLVLGMYADGHLAMVEDERLHEFLKRQGIETEDERRRNIGEAITRMEHHAGNAATRHQQLAELAARLDAPAARSLALSTLERLLCVDEKYPRGEEHFWTEVRKVFNC
jgi:hypothetical protein